MVRGDELRARTKAYALRVIALVEALPRGATAAVLGRQLLRAATSVGANDRAACRARSPEDFVAKLKIVEEEADECLYWPELPGDSGLAPRERVADLLTEGEELLAITVASIKTVRSQKR